MARSISQKEYDKRSAQLLEKLRRDVSIFPNDSEAKKIKRKKRAREDLLYFCKTYLPHHFEDAWEQGHCRMAESTATWDKVLHWVGFRGVGKSTLAITGYAMQAILFKFTRYLPIISDTTGQAELLMLPLKVELENNPRIKNDFGPQAGVTWANDELVTRDNVKVECHSWRSFKRGRKHMQWRAQLAICDDLENLESVKKPANVDHREDALFGDILNALDLKKRFQILVITNKLGRDDLTHRLKENEQVLTIEVPAELDDATPAHPKSFPKKVLDNIKKTIGIVRYAREFLLEIISSEHDDFQQAWFTWVAKPQERHLYRVMALDPSVGSTEGHDTKAIVCIDLTEDLQHFDVVDSWIRHATIGSMCKQLFKMNTRLKPDEVVIESNGFQILIKEKLINMARNQPDRMELLTKVSRMNNRVPKNTRIMRTQPMVENGTMRYVKGAGDNQMLVNQKLDFKSDRTDNTDDGPDAEEMATRRLKEKAGMISNEVECQIIE